MLPEIAWRFLQLVDSPEALRVHGICMANAESHPELGELYFEHGPLETVRATQAYLEAQVRAGRLRIERTDFAAWQFLCMLMAEQHMRMELGLPPLPEADVRRYADDCVATFLRAHAP